VSADVWSSSPVSPGNPASPWPQPAGGVRAALASFAQLTQVQAPTASDIDYVMRSLSEHDGWLVPVEYAHQTWGQAVFDQMIPFPDRGPLAMLCVFTDAQAAALGEGTVSGDYGGPVPGSKLLQYLDPGLSALYVNPGSPREHQFYFEANSFDLAAGWGTAIAVERALAEWGNAPAPRSELLTHRFQLLIERDTQAPAQVFLPDIDGVVAVCFTASDRTAEFVASLPPGARPLAEVTAVEGRALFELVRNMGAAGVVINAGSDDQTALTPEDIAEIIGVRR
jgi:hypothetical protein